MKLKKTWQLLIIIIVMILFPPIIKAEELNVQLNCPTETTVGSTIQCTVELTPNEPIKGIQINYDWNEAFSVQATELGTDWEKLSASASGISLINVDGVYQKSNLSTVTFFVSDKAVPGQEYELKLKNIVLSDGEKDIPLEDQTTKIKISSVTNIVTGIKVNNNPLEIKDGITNYTINVENQVKSATVEATLNSADYSFQEDFGPRTVNDLKEGNNPVYLKITNNSNDVLIYTININRLSKDESNETTTNPKTGMSSFFIISAILIISLGIMITSYQKILYKEK